MRTRTLAAAAAALRQVHMMRMVSAGYGSPEAKAAAEGMSAPVPKPKHPEVQIYFAGGDPGRVRVKWSCARCSRRNDRPIAWPVKETEILACKFCHSQARFTITKKTEPAPEEASP